MAYSGEGFLMFGQDGTGKAVPITATLTAAGTATLGISTPFNAGSDTLSAPGAGVTQSAISGVKSYSIQVKGIGGTPTAWSVVLEASLNNIDFTTVLTHNTGTGNGRLLATVNQFWPALFFRSRIVSVTLGPATSLSIQILGME